MKALYIMCDHDFVARNTSLKYNCKDRFGSSHDLLYFEMGSAYYDHTLVRLLPQHSRRGAKKYSAQFTWRLKYETELLVECHVFDRSKCSARRLKTSGKCECESYSEYSLTRTTASATVVCCSTKLMHALTS